VIVFNVYLRKIALQEVGVSGIIFKRELQIKRNNAFDSWKVSGFTCIERALNGLFDIQDACTAPSIINKLSRTLHLL
jgi:hypothetical protein